MNSVQVRDGSTEKETLYRQLVMAGTNLRNREIFASIIASRSFEEGVMPAHLGIGLDAFNKLIRVYFPGVELPGCYFYEQDAEGDRFQEQQELMDLLRAYRVDFCEETNWMVRIVTAGCMGGNHLWQDLGLWSRMDLTVLMQSYFPKLALKNDRDMKWKKFLYKQLCLAEGIYVCRAPTCEVCPDYHGCFGPEE